MSFLQYLHRFVRNWKKNKKDKENTKCMITANGAYGVNRNVFPFNFFKKYLQFSQKYGRINSEYSFDGEISVSSG